MDGDLRYSVKPPSADAFAALYATTGWRVGGLDESSASRALASSWATCSVYEGDKLVGFGRVISDGVLHAFITEMIVCPDQRGRGVGGQILGRLIKRCRQAHIEDIQLFCAEGREPFYRNHGFEPRPITAPGMQYIQDGSSQPI